MPVEPFPDHRSLLHVPGRFECSLERRARNVRRQRQSRWKFFPDRLESALMISPEFRLATDDNSFRERVKEIRTRRPEPPRQLIVRQIPRPILSQDGINERPPPMEALD